MLKNHPKGLLVAFFTNMGERFGFYVMMAILVLFLQAKYGLSESVAGEYYSWFYFAIYALALIGGILADYTGKYKLVILVGQLIMFMGYGIIALPDISLDLTLSGLFIIALGNGLFKGNLQAVVGQLYDDEKYAKVRDSAFMIFYMGINIGAFFAPFVAMGVRNWWLEQYGFLHDGSLPALCHQMISGILTDHTQLQALANSAVISGESVVDLKAFALQYVDVFSRGYNWAFAIASGAMLLSLMVYIIFGRFLPNKTKMVSKAKNTEQKTEFKRIILSLAIPIVLFFFTTIAIHMLGILINQPKTLDYKLGAAIALFVAFVSYMFLAATKEEKPRIMSLVLVFIVVIFFWMSFHQNGLTLTFFARDYTDTRVDKITNLFFNLPSILCVICTIVGAVIALRNVSKLKEFATGLIVFLLAGVGCFYYISTALPSNAISPEVFQSFNPLFIVALTPLVMGIFSYLNRKQMEPSTPKKIGIGMVIASLGFFILLIGSLNLVSPYLLEGTALGESGRISPYWLMSSYLILTFAELFLSPMGLSFVSKVAPSRFQGLMQGGWLLATAIGNKLLFVGSLLWDKIELYILWGIFVIACLASAFFIFAIMKRLENATKS